MGETSPVLEAHDLVFRYRERSAPVLHGCSLRLGPGERLLLEGPSGGGKSTLATLLFTGTFAFNLLLGRRWPPHPEDMAQAPIPPP